MSLVPPLLAGTRPLPRILFGLAAAAAAAAQLWPAPAEPAAPTPSPAPVAPAAIPGGPALDRPPFDPERRPWTARGDRALVLAPDPVRPVLTLRGILIEGGTARALIDDGGGTRAWLARGEGRGGWRIAAIGPDRVTLDQGGHLYTAEFLGKPATLRPAPLQIVPDAEAPPLRR